VERRGVAEANFEAVMAHERRLSPELGGRTVRGWVEPRQAGLFDDA